MKHLQLGLLRICEKALQECWRTFMMHQKVFQRAGRFTLFFLNPNLCIKQKLNLNLPFWFPINFLGSHQFILPKFFLGLHVIEMGVCLRDRGASLCSWCLGFFKQLESLFEFCTKFKLICLTITMDLFYVIMCKKKQKKNAMFLCSSTCTS